MTLTERGRVTAIASHQLPEAAFCELAGLVMGPEVEHVLKVVYLKEGVR